jgi:hypothetical protein
MIYLVNTAVTDDLRLLQKLYTETWILQPGLKINDENLNPYIAKEFFPEKELYRIYVRLKKDGTLLREPEIFQISFAGQYLLDILKNERAIRNLQILQTIGQTMPHRSLVLAYHDSQGESLNPICIIAGILQGTDVRIQNIHGDYSGYLNTLELAKETLSKQVGSSLENKRLV